MARWRGLRVVHQDRHRIGGLEWRTAGEQPERDAAKGIDVGTAVERLIRDELRREKGRRAENHARGGDLRPLTRVARHDAEVHDLDEVVFGSQTTDEQIGWLDVAVHEANACALPRATGTPA
jgi:hypothetical protein